MPFIGELPIWWLAGLIFLLRIIDVSLGTIRTVTIIEGKPTAAAILGFFELLVWVVVVAQVIARLDESLLLAVAYAGGFAAGNAVGIAVERRLAHGTAVLRMISDDKGQEIARALRRLGQMVTTFSGEGQEGPVTLVYAAAPRRNISKLLERATSVDPSMFFVVERANTLMLRPGLVPRPTGWRALAKRK